MTVEALWSALLYKAKKKKKTNASFTPMCSIAQQPTVASASYLQDTLPSKDLASAS